MHLEAELLEQPTLAITLLVLALEHCTGILKELLLGDLIGEGVWGKVTLESLDHSGLNRVPSWHDMGVVDDLGESLDTRAASHKLLHLRRSLAHGLGDGQRGLGDTCHNAVPVWALLVALIIRLKDNGLLASIATLQADYDLPVLQDCKRKRRSGKCERCVCRPTTASSSGQSTAKGTQTCIGTHI